MSVVNLLSIISGYEPFYNVNEDIFIPYKMRITGT